MNIDIKTLIALASLVMGVLLVIGPKLKEWLAASTSTNKSNPVADYFQAVVSTEKAKKEKEAAGSDLECLEGLIKGLDPNEHKEQIDTLIDKIAPSLIRQRLKK